MSGIEEINQPKMRVCSRCNKFVDVDKEWCNVGKMCVNCCEGCNEG